MNVTFTEHIHRSEQRRGRATYTAVDVEPGTTGLVVDQVGPDPYVGGETIYLVELASGQIVAARASQVAVE